MSGDEDFELDLDLESALDAWEADFGKDGTLRSESSPMPQSIAPPPVTKPPPPVTKPPPAVTQPPRPAATRTDGEAPSPRGRPLYRPDPSLFRSEPRSGPDPLDQFPSFADDEEDDEEESTRIASIPEDLIASLNAQTQEPSPSSTDVELDLDSLFPEEAEDEVTRVGEVEGYKPGKPLDAFDPLAGLERELLGGTPTVQPDAAPVASSGDARDSLDTSDIDGLLDGLEMEVPDTGDLPVAPDATPAAPERVAPLPPPRAPPPRISSPRVSMPPPLARATSKLRSSLDALRAKRRSDAPPASTDEAAAEPVAIVATELVATELDAAELDAAELAATEVAATELVATELDAAELDAAELAATELVPSRGDADRIEDVPLVDVPSGIEEDADDALFVDEPSIEAPEPPVEDPSPIGDALDALSPSIPAPSSAPTDAGAATARRTVGHRKPRKESYALVGRTADVQRHRIALLRGLANSAEGTRAARLLCAAAELEMQLGRSDEARELIAAAREADPSDLATLRDARRDAVARGDWRAVESLLEAEVALPLSALDRCGALMLLAELRCGPLGEVDGAIEAAAAAVETSPTGAAGLLLAELLHAADRSEEAALALGRCDFGDAEMADVMTALSARVRERAGDHEAARTSYSGTTIDHALGRARTAADVAGRQRALTEVATSAEDPLLVELASRAAALAALEAGDPAWATNHLQTIRRPASLRVRARASALADDPATREACLDALGAATGGTDRALALVSLAEVRAERGDLEGADLALRDAALADERLGTVQVVREVLARRAGDPTRLASATQSDMESGNQATRGAIEIAAKHALHSKDGEAEFAQLRQALEQATTPRAADVLLLDAAAARGDMEAMHAALRRQAERSAPERRLGALLALADRLGDPTGVLAEARDAAPGDPTATRPLARVVRASDPQRAATAWLEEADGADRERAAFAALVAARIRLESGDVEGAHAAARRSLQSMTGPGPAAWLLDGDLGQGLDGDERLEMLEDVAEGEGPEASLAEVHSRVALSGGGGLAWQRALRRAPDDPILRERVIASPEVDAGERAKLLTAIAEGSAGPTARVARLRAGALNEAASEFATAAAHYRAVLEEGPDPIASRALDRAELADGAFARVAERRFAAVRDTEGTPRALAALEALVALDLHERQDATSAVLTLQSILQDAPGHVPTLRALERYYMEHGRDDSLADTSTAFAAHMADARDVCGHARLATRLLLAPPDAKGDAADAMLRRVANGALGAAPLSPDRVWVARRIRTASDDAAVRARTLRLVIDSSSDEERPALLAAWVDDLAQVEDPAALATELASREGNGHPRLSEALAWLYLRLEEDSAAAKSFERAASMARDDRHRLYLFDVAAAAWERSANAPAAVAALERAAQIDVAYGDVFDRLRVLLQASGDSQRLAKLAEARVAAGADEATLLSLHETQAQLKSTLGDRTGAKEALRAALGIEPHRVDALEKLARICLEDEDWRGAAEALIRFARLRQDREDLRWVFFTLGDIYDRHLPDFQRAEAAFRRVLKLVPEDLETRERLCRLYEREGEWAKAIESLREIIDIEIDPDARRVHGIALARAFEQSGDARSAEQVLDGMRRGDPLELSVLRAMAELYGRQNAQAALGMHLNRAIGDYRRFIEEQPTEFHGWSGLCDVLEWRSLPDAARVVASAAAAVGVVDLELGRRIDERGGAPGVGAAAADPDLHEILAPKLLTPATLEVFRTASETLEKLLPFDARQWRAEKAGRREEGLRAEALRVAQWFGFNDVTILLTDAAPRICVPVGMSPLTLVMGREVSQATDAHQRAFLFARAAKIASTHLGVAMRTPPGQLGLVLAALVRTFDPNHEPPHLDPAELAEMTRRVGKALPRRIRDTLGAAAVEMGGTAGFDAARLGLAAAELGDRTALLALGSAPAAIDGLLRLASADIPERGRPDPRIAAIRAIPEADDLLRFATSDAHFEARRRTGADRS